MLQDDPLWYDRVEAGEPEGPVLRGVAVAFVALGRISSFPNTLWTMAERLVSGRTSVIGHGEPSQPGPEPRR